MYQPNPISSAGTSQNNPVAHEQMELGSGAVAPHNGGNNNPSMAARQRLRWTNELHERFVEAVTQLGGPDSTSLLLYLVFPFFCGMFCFVGLINYYLQRHCNRKLCLFINVFKLRKYCLFDDLHKLFL
jgi:hypothetical protein